MEKQENLKSRYLSLNFKILISIIVILIIIVAGLAYVISNNYIHVAVSTEQRNLENVNNVAIDALSSASRVIQYVNSLDIKDNQELDEILSAQNYIDNLHIGKVGFFVAFNEQGQIKLHSNLENIENYDFEEKGNCLLIYEEILNYAIANTPKEITENNKNLDRGLIGEKQMILNGKRYDEDFILSTSLELIP